MIVFDLECRAGGHRFEGWFGSSVDFADQQERGLVSCPECGSAEVAKAPMAAKLARKGNQRTTTPAPKPDEPQKAMSKGAMRPEALRMMQALAAMQSDALKDSRWVGAKFAEESRAMHYGERDTQAIHGQATLEEAKALHDEGIEVAPLLFPVVAPAETN